MSLSTATAERDVREELSRAVADLLDRLPKQPTTQLADLSTAREEDLDRIFHLAGGLVAAVAMHVQYDAVYRGDGPPTPCANLENQVMRYAGELVWGNIRNTDLVLRVGATDLAVLLLRAGPLEARAQAGRLRHIVADQRFEQNGYHVRWHGRLAVASNPGAQPEPGAARAGIRSLVAAAA